jgi:hypothetical protein
MGERDTFLCFEDRSTGLDGADSMNRLEPRQETVGIDALHRAQFPKRCGVLRTNPEPTIGVRGTDFRPHAKGNRSSSFSRSSKPTLDRQKQVPFKPKNSGHTVQQRKHVQSNSSGCFATLPPCPTRP